jgi:hypothetical protein
MDIEIRTVTAHWEHFFPIFGTVSLHSRPDDVIIGDFVLETWRLGPPLLAWCGNFSGKLQPFSHTFRVILQFN